MPTLRLSHPQKEGILHASKYLKFQVLLTCDELKKCFAALPDFSLIQVSRPIAPSEAIVPRETFFEAYEEYVENLKQGKSFHSPLFSAALCADDEFLYAMPAGDRILIKQTRPLIQIREHHFTFSRDENLFRSMILGQDSIPWGLDFSYPQITQNSLTGDLFEVYRDQSNRNTQLFKALAKWIRANSLPAKLHCDGQKVTATFRLGKNWNGPLPQLQTQGLTHVG